MTAADTSDPIAVLHRLGAGRYGAATAPRFWNQIGPFGGWVAALALQAMRAEVAPTFKPRSFTAHLFGALAAGEVLIDVHVHRLQRTVAALRAELGQDGKTAVVAEGVFGVDREGLSLSGGWLRQPGSAALAPEHLLLLADAWCPPVWAALGGPVPVTTLSMTALFQASGPQAPAGDGFVAARHRTERVADGYADERGELWWPDGSLALLTQQLTWIDFSKPHKRA